MWQAFGDGVADEQVVRSVRVVVGPDEVHEWPLARTLFEDVRGVVDDVPAGELEALPRFGACVAGLA